MAAPLAFNVSVPSDGLQGRTRLEKPLHKWLDGSDEAVTIRASSIQTRPCYP